jgi:hypothetical protein
MLNIGADDSGCLARVPGDVIARVLEQLPKPDEAASRIVAASVQVADLGEVRITCVLRRNPRWNRRYWTALRADVL